MGPKRNARINVDPTKGTKEEEDETKKRRTTEATASGEGAIENASRNRKPS